MLSTELGVAEREGRYGFRRARRGPSVGHALFGRVNSAECPGAQPTPTHPLPSLLHTAIYHPLADYQEFRDRFPKRHLSLSPSCVLRIRRSIRSPPSAERLELLCRQQRQQQPQRATWLFSSPHHLLDSRFDAAPLDIDDYDDYAPLRQRPWPFQFPVAPSPAPR